MIFLAGLEKIQFFGIQLLFIP